MHQVQILPIKILELLNEIHLLQDVLHLNNAFKAMHLKQDVSNIPANIYLFKVSNGNTKKI